MREHLPKFVIVALLLAVIGLPFLLKVGRSKTEAAVSRKVAGDATSRLIIYTPHNEQIRFEFAEGFNRYRAARGEPAVVFDWRASGGTSDLRKQILSQYEAISADGGEAALDQRGIGADLFFGGGEYDHNKIAKGVSITGADGKPTMVPVAQAPVLPEGLLEEAFPEPTIGGEMLYRPDLLWVGTTLSSFGIVYNRDAIGSCGVAEPATWLDLAQPELSGWVALSDPGHSGSIAATYNTILKRVGWAEGWALLRRSFANARYFTASSSKVPVDVSAGEAAAGMCIDFYGRYQAGAVADRSGVSRVGYIDPAGMTATTADPITLLRGAPHETIANQFIAWLLSPEAQSLWQRKVGSEGGPVKFELRRQPIRSDFYTAQERAHWTDPEIDPFGQARPIPKGTPDYFSYVAPIAHAIAIDIHGELKAAWEAINQTPVDHPNRDQMMELFDQLPPELTINWPDEALASDWWSIMQEADHPRREEVVGTLKAFTTGLNERWSDEATRLRDRLLWTRFFKANYEQIVRLSRG